MILATLGTSMVKVLVVTRCHAQYGAVHNHRDLCDTPLADPIAGAEDQLNVLPERIEHIQVDRVIVEDNIAYQMKT